MHTLARLCLLAWKTKILDELMEAPDATTAHTALVAAEAGLLPAEEPVEAKGKGRKARGAA